MAWLTPVAFEESTEHVTKSQEGTSAENLDENSTDKGELSFCLEILAVYVGK